jgi:hypothetical protein
VRRTASQLRLLGFDARRIASRFDIRYRLASKSGNSDANDAAAICEPTGRPHARSVLTKAAAQAPRCRRAPQMTEHNRQGRSEQRESAVAVDVLKRDATAVLPAWSRPRCSPSPMSGSGRDRNSVPRSES